MNDTKNTDDKSTTAAPKKTLTLRRTVEQGTVKQSFSHGRTKAVVVEKKKSRTHSEGHTAEGAAAPTVPPQRSIAEGLKPRAPQTSAPARQERRRGRLRVETVARLRTVLIEQENTRGSDAATAR